ncbi:MAG: 2-oxoacid:acceptor oxidoreductase family protein [gamma proteobacterium endosymbiont of Lamellibrachia anaximandri]|nr:2-oxoacid:acceptor oxidoreductase family protein [gamma proteobacterium endosymbiont of Lamellibrachia anaximandri]MBL3617712.1 2-oxoacid:acceptor oxidoreductase family protein [gamma proteobacterium endosymbiont of Lamellibrachia anaximandri]
MFGKKETKTFKYPGIRMAMAGNEAVVRCEREASDAAGAYPITPSTEMGEIWAQEMASGHVNISDRTLIFVEPESEHAAAAVTAGMSMTGLRSTNFSSAQGVAFMHESLYAAAGKRLPYVLNIGARAITKASLNVHCGHDDFHCIDDTGFIQMFANNAQGAADLNLIGRKTAELALTPAAIGQDGFLTTHLIEPVQAPERELIAEFLGRPDDEIESPTPAQKMLYGETRRRVPLVWDVDNPMQSGTVQNQDAHMQTTAAQRPYFYDHVAELAEQAMEEYYQLTGRRYARIGSHNVDEADYVIVGMGSMVVQAHGVAAYLEKTRQLKIGVVDITLYRPFPGDLLGKVLKGKKGVAVLERTDQPLAEDLPLIREVRATISKCIENGQAEQNIPYPEYATYSSFKDAPRLFSGCYGIGSRDLQPESLIGAIENMLPEGEQKRFFYLGIDFVREAANPKQEIHIQKMLDAYPNVGELTVKGSENPNLMPEGSITVRMHSVGGWGAITTGKNLVMTLYDLLGYEIKANPKYGSEKKGQPTTYFLSAAPTPIPLNCEYHFVDVVLSPDPNVYSHSNPLAGLKKGGTLIIQSNLDSPEAVWASFPHSMQQQAVDNDIKIFYIDGFKIAREEATNPELQLRMQGNAFQGAFFAGSPLMEMAGLDEKKLFQSIEDQLQHKFGAKGQRVVEDNLRIVRRGFDEIHPITNMQVGVQNAGQLKKEIGMPVMLKHLPESDGGVSDVHRFWEQTGSFYATGKGTDNLADPYQALSLVPASTGIFRDMTQIRFEYPKWVAENCTACGDCYTICPDSSIPGLVNTIGEIFTSVIDKIETGGMPTQYLRRETRKVEKRLRELVNEQGESAEVRNLLDQAILETIAASDPEEETEDTGKRRSDLEAEFGRFVDALGSFDFAATKPYWNLKEKKAPNSGGLFSITINPYTCKGCMECVDVCEDLALVAEPQDNAAIEKMRNDWDFWLDLPTSNESYSRIDDLDEKIGALETLLLDKANYNSMNCGDGSCLGCGEKTATHLFTGTITALMQPRVKAQMAKLDDLIARLEQHIRLKLASGVDLNDTDALNRAADAEEGDLSLSRLSDSIDPDHENTLVDKEWLKWATGVLNQLRDLHWRYREGQTGNGRAEMGIVNATGCTSVWGSTYPFNPYPFPWTSHLFQDSPSVAMGLFEGHMVKMAEGFKAIRHAELELAGKFNPVEHNPFFQQFNWKDFSDDEWLMCPPVVSVGGDGAMYDIGFQNLSRAMASGMPIKVLVLDTQVYSNTGGQACTSGFISQISDMAPYGKAMKGKEEMRKEMGLIGIAHRTSYVLQGSVSNTTHLIEGYIDGLNSRRPALFNIYAVCQPEHGVADDATARQSKIAVESRAYPLMKFDPDAGETLQDCIDLEGNPAIEEDWPSYSIDYIDENDQEAKLEVPMTFADFAVTEGRFRKHFRTAPPETWGEEMIPFHRFLDLDEDEREGNYPYIWGVDGKNRLMRILCSEEIVKSAEERRQFWHQLKGIAGELDKVDVNALVEQAKVDMANRLSSTLLSMAASGNATALAGSISANGHSPDGGIGAAPAGDYEPVWIETPECTACDECTDINPKIFAYNDDKLAVVIDPQAGTYKDIVKAAEKCTAGCLHPGTPWNMGEKDIEKLVKRAEKFQ